MKQQPLKLIKNPPQLNMKQIITTMKLPKIMSTSQSTNLLQLTTSLPQLTNLTIIHIKCILQQPPLQRQLIIQHQQQPTLLQQHILQPLQLLTLQQLQLQPTPLPTQLLTQQLHPQQQHLDPINLPDTGTLHLFLLQNHCPSQLTRLI